MTMIMILATSRGLWDLSSPTRDRTWAPAVKAPSPNHWTQGIPKPHYLILNED